MKNGKIKQIEERWTRKIADLGWTAIPNVILENQSELGLKSTDMNVLIHLLSHWWEKDNLPHPAKSTIAEKMGVSSKTVQRSIAKMQKLGLVERKERRSAHKGLSGNDHDFIII